MHEHNIAICILVAIIYYDYTAQLIQLLYSHVANVVQNLHVHSCIIIITSYYNMIIKQKAKITAASYNAE